MIKRAILLWLPTCVLAILTLGSSAVVADEAAGKTGAEMAHSSTGEGSKTATADNQNDHEHAHPGHKGMGKAEAVDWRSDLAIYSFVVFLLLMAVLTKFAWGPISQALDQREDSIAENIASAQRAADEAKAMLGQYEAKLAGAADQVRGMLEEARRDAESTKADIISEARLAAQQEHDRAMREIRTATDGAIKQLAEKSADLATELAGKMLRAQMTKADHGRLVEESVAQFIAGSSERN